MSFGKINKLDDVLVTDGLPRLDFVFEGVDEVVLGEGFVLGKVDFVNEVLLLYHFAGDDLGVLSVSGEVGLGETALAQHLVLDGIATVHHLQSVTIIDSFLHLLLYRQDIITAL